MSQNDKNFYLWLLIFQEPYIIWSSFMVHMYLWKDNISRHFFHFFFFKILIFRNIRGQGGKRAKNGPKWQKILSVSLCISGTVHHGDTIILHMCTMNVNHMMYGSWEMEHDTEFLSFWTIFCTFTPLKTQKNQDFEKLKKKPRDLSFYTSVLNHDHMLYCSSDMVRDGCNCYFSFWAIFCPFTPITAQKIKISKQWKTHLETSSFYTSVQRITIIWLTVPEIWYATGAIVI